MAKTIRINGETPFQIENESAFSISATEKGYTLQWSADGKTFSDVQAVEAQTNHFCINVPAGAFIRLKGNTEMVTVNY